MAETDPSPVAPEDLTRALERVSARFDRAGVLGILLIEASVLARIETEHGEEARAKVREALALLIGELAADCLAPEDLVLHGLPDRNEIVVAVFRPHRHAHFYRQELPGIDRRLRQELEQRWTQVFYPYLRSAPELPSGVAVAMRNPKLSPETQITAALREARADAELNRRLSARRRRREIVELVLDRSITSVYEPIVDVQSRTVFGYEALARGPQGSDLHGALALFSTAEREDLVYELDCLCRASGLEGAIDFPSGTKLFLNIRPTTIHDPNFKAERLIETLARCRLEPSDVVFEISEQESISSFDAFLEIRDYYRSLGFQVALDDTGTGYAGLEALLRLSPDYIKVDRAFVSGVDQDPARQELIGALRSVAQRTGARLIGEGLSTLEELEMLQELDIEFGQGWLFGKPHPLRAL